MFIAVGPPSFTSLAIIALANDFPGQYEYWGMDATTIQILRVLSTVVAIFVWSLSLWYFCIAVLACLIVRKQMSFHLNWWAFVFPNVGFTIATISIGKSLRSEGIKWVGSVMTLLLIITYLCVGVAHVRAFIRKELCWPGMDSDFYKREQHRKHNLNVRQKERLGVLEPDVGDEEQGEKCD